MSCCKRMTSAESAAELWKMRYDHAYEGLMLEELRSAHGRGTSMKHWIDALATSRERMIVLARFASYPHFDA